jgi:hypothetical protein
MMGRSSAEMSPSRHREPDILDYPGVALRDISGTRYPGDARYALRKVQFTKTPEVLAGRGLSDLRETPEALRELREKGVHLQAAPWVLAFRIFTGSGGAGRLSPPHD